MRWLIIVLVAAGLMLIAAGCEAEEEEKGTPTLSPAATAEASPPATPEATTAAATGACVDREELASYWPPQGTVTYSEHLPTVDIDVSTIPFDEVQVLATGCGDARGRGEEAYVAYQVTLPAGFPFEKGAVLSALAAVPATGGPLENIGSLPEGLSDCRLHLQDVTGDGSDEIIFDRPGGASWGMTSIWSWHGGSPLEVFRGGSYLAEVEFRDLNGDGVLELVTYARLGRVPVGWPRAHRWDGQLFRPALFPEAYDEFVESALASLESEAPPPAPDMEVLRTALGHAYERQGATAQARTEYEQAWALYEATSQGPPPCTDAAQAVQEFYVAVDEAVHGLKGLGPAYSMVGEDFRQAQPFPEFAAGFARTEEMMLIGVPEVYGQEGEARLVSVRVATHELTPQGEVVERFTATWRVRQKDEVCVLESARVSRSF